MAKSKNLWDDHCENCKEDPILITNYANLTYFIEMNQSNMERKYVFNKRVVCDLSDCLVGLNKTSNEIDSIEYKISKNGVPLLIIDHHNKKGDYLRKVIQEE
jgi:hypothetical protein